MIVAKGQITYITELQRKQVDEIQWWGQHTDPLFKSYNFPIMNKKERDYWYKSKKFSFTKRCFGVCNLEGRFVGYIALRNIRWFRKISELGIVFDPNHLNKGYGTDSLKSFLKYYFENMKMKELELKVALFNKRAEKCYEKCGFYLRGVKYDVFEDQQLSVFEDEDLVQYRQFFKKQGNQLLCCYKNMYITKEMLDLSNNSFVHIIHLEQEDKSLKM